MPQVEYVFKRGIQKTCTVKRETKQKRLKKVLESVGRKLKRKNRKEKTFQSLTR